MANILPTTDSGWTYNIDTTSIIQSRNENVSGTLWVDGTVNIRCGGYSLSSSNIFFVSRIYNNFDLSG